MGLFTRTANTDVTTLAERLDDPALHVLDVLPRTTPTTGATRGLSGEGVATTAQ
jgi:hypothetical protein